MAFDPRDPDASLVALFKNHPMPNKAKSAEQGRPIFDDMEIVEVRFAGSRNWSPFPAHARSHWSVDPHTGEQIEVTYAERFARQYRQFREHAAQTKTGTPLEYVPFLTVAQRTGLHAVNLYTVEQLAAIDGQELKNIGQGGREWKNLAQEYLAETKNNAPNAQLQAELEALRAKNLVLQDDLERAKTAAPNGGSEFEDMTELQLRDYIKTHSGHEPQGNLNRKTLMQMATGMRPHKAV
jgi:hypothetical protein